MFNQKYIKILPGRTGLTKKNLKKFQVVEV
jgi:hypothetical protein